MSNSRRTVRPVRQLSLQQTTSRRQHIRRQRSAEDDKSLQIYANPITRGRLAVRVAWGDDRHGGDSDLERVEVVARQIPSRSKQTTSGRSGGKNYVVGGEKASILYSRQELAERLRLAWKHREENKSNIDIFLAHGFTVEEQCDSELSISAPATPLPKNEPAFGREKVTANWRGDSAKLNSSQEKFINVFGESKDSGLENGSGEVGETNDNEKSKTASSDTTKSDLAMRNSEEEGTTESTKKKDKENVTDLNVEEKRRTRINIDCTNLHPQHRSTASFPSLKAEIPAISTKVNGNDDFSAARQKRASFHSGTNRAFLVPMTEKPAKVPAEANKCLATDKLVSAKSMETTRCTSASSNRIVRQATTDVKSSTVFDRSIVLTRSSSTISPEKARRTNSAPPQRRTQGGEDGGGNSIFAQRVQVNIVIDTPGLAEVTNNKSIACGQQDGKNAVERQEEGLAKISRPVRSAFLKKRSRSAKRRFLASSGAAGKDEAQDRCGGRARAYMDPRTTDVVTMVSLVSSVDSDSDTENSPRDDKLINELRSKLPTTPIIKTSINPNPSVTRKPIKSDSARETHLQTSTRTKDEKLIIGVQPARFNCVVNGHGENESSWRQQQNPAEEIATPLTVSTLLIQDLTETTPETALLTDREKRCLAVPIGDLHDDKKRKLLRTRSISSRPSIPEQTSNNASVEVKEQRPPHLVEGSTSPINGRTPLPKTEQYVKEMLPVKEIPPREVTLSTEPRFQTTKEKECWHLYRRMCDKGVCVSFDTVLRGMLTPTEYRLRQKELSQDL